MRETRKKKLVDRDKNISTRVADTKIKENS
jgi:hypothetical protein